MTQTFEFDWKHELPNGETVEIVVEAEISTYYPASMPDPRGAGAPEEGGEVHIRSVHDKSGNSIDVTFDELLDPAIDAARSQGL